MQSEKVAASLTRTHPQSCSKKLRDFGAQHLRFHSSNAFEAIHGGEVDVHCLFREILREAEVVDLKPTTRLDDQCSE